MSRMTEEKDEQLCSLPPGSRDRTGRAVVEVYGEEPGWASHHVSVQSLCELLLYLHFIPRYPKLCPRGISQRPEMQNIFLVKDSISLSHIGWLWPLAWLGGNLPQRENLFGFMNTCNIMIDHKRVALYNLNISLLSKVKYTTVAGAAHSFRVNSSNYSF